MGTQKDIHTGMGKAPPMSGTIQGPNVLLEGKSPAFCKVYQVSEMDKRAGEGLPNFVENNVFCFYCIPVIAL